MKQITEDYCNFEVAKLLKEKGFDSNVYTCYTDCEFPEFLTMIDYVIQGEEYERSNFESHNLIQAPTHQMTLKWLREVHRIETHIVLSELNADNSRKYMFDIYSSDINRDFDSVQKEGFNSYEQAVEAACLYVLKNLI